MEPQKSNKKKVDYYFDGRTASSQSSDKTGYNTEEQNLAEAPAYLQSQARYQKMSSKEPEMVQKLDVMNHSGGQAGDNEKLVDEKAYREQKSLDQDKRDRLEFTTISNLATGTRFSTPAMMNTSVTSSGRLTMRQETSRVLAASINKGTAWRVLGALTLITAIIGGSSIGTIANFIPAETSFAKNSWRSGILVSIFIIPAIVEYFYKRHEVNYRDLISFKQYGFLLLTLLCQVLWTAGLIYASLNTIQSQAYVFNNVHGLYIVLISLFVGVVPSRKEWIGVSLAIVGCILIIMDPEASRVQSSATPGIGQSFWPAIIDLVSAFFGALYFIMSAKNVKSLPVCLLILLMNMHTWMINGMVAKYQNPAIELLSFDVETGCLGFLNLAQNAWLPLFCYALFASFFGSAGYVLCLLFYSPLVTSNAYLLEPFFAQMLGFGLGLDQLPGICTALGTLAAVGGIAFIDSGSRDRTAITEKGDEKLNQNDNVDASGFPIELSQFNQSGMMSMSGLNISYFSGR